MTFSASDAAFEGFRIVRRRPLAVLAWALAYIVVFGLGFLLIGQQALSVAQQVEALQATSEPTMAELGPIFQAYGLIFGVTIPLYLVLSTALSTAVARSVVQPKASAFGYLKLGMDELRVLGAFVVLGLLLMAYYVAAALICVGLGVFAHMSGQWWGWLLCGLAGIGAVLGLVWLAVRLSLMVPIMVAEHRFALFDSFKMTKGRFWPLLGMALLAFVMVMVVSMLGWIITTPVTLLTGGNLTQQFQALEGRPTGEILTALAPVLIVTGILNAILSALQLAVMYAPFAAAYLALKPAPVEA